MRGLGLVVLLASRIAAGEPSGAFEDGKQLLRDGKPAEACAKFEAALREQPEAPGILLNLGLCNARQNKLATALKWYRRAQTRAAERGQVETEDAAKLQTVALAAKVPAIGIALAGDLPPDAAVTVDGTTIDRTSLARLEIDAGMHVVELHGSELEPARETIEVRDDATPDTIVTLRARPAQHRAAPPPATMIVEVDRGRGWRRWGYVAGGAGAGLLAGATVLGLVGRQRFDGTHDLATRQRWKGIVRYGGTAMFGAGVAAAGTALVLILAAPAPERVERPMIAPMVGDGTVGLAVGGSL